MDQLIGSIGYGNFILVLCVLVFVHELGHYLVARMCGVRVETFSVGFGREIFGWTDRGNTRWKISILPLGGYVKMFGEHSIVEEGDTPGRPRAMTAEERAVSFSHKSVGQRAAIVVAGPAANFLFAIVALAILFVAVGRPVPADFAEQGIGHVQEGSAAAAAGMQTGDRILAVNGAPVQTFDDLRRTVLGSGGEALHMQVLRDGREIELVATPDAATVETEHGESVQYRLGVHGPLPEYKQLGAAEALIQGGAETWRMTSVTLTAVWEMIVGSRGTEELGGPVRIVQLSNDFAQMGALSLVGFTVLLSINLGLINLFPIPMLDGGHLVFIGIEALRGKPLDERIQEYSLRIGLALILFLMIFVTVNDFIHIDS